MESIALMPSIYNKDGQKVPNAQAETILRLLNGACKEFCRSSVNMNHKVLDWNVFCGDLAILKVYTQSNDNTGLLYLTDAAFLVSITPEGFIIKATRVDSKGYAEPVTSDVRQSGIKFT